MELQCFCTVLLCLLVALCHISTANGVKRQIRVPANSHADIVDREYCVLPLEVCGNGDCSPPMRAGLFDVTDLKSQVGETFVWRQNHFLYLTIKAFSPYTISAHMAQHMRLYIGSQLPLTAQGQYLDGLRHIQRPVACATITFNLYSVCLPGCVYHMPTDECVCAPAHSRSPRRASPAVTDRLFFRASLYLSLSVHLCPMGPTVLTNARAVHATMHTINWAHIGRSACSTSGSPENGRGSGSAFNGNGNGSAENGSGSSSSSSSRADCMPTLQLHYWGAVLEWRNPDWDRHVATRIAEFHQRQGHLHRHVPHYKIVPGVTVKSLVRVGMRQFLINNLPLDQAGSQQLTDTAASHYRDDDEDDAF